MLILATLIVGILVFGFTKVLLAIAGTIVIIVLIAILLTLLDLIK